MIQLSGVNLGKKFNRRILFRRLSLTLNGGQSLAITGANGSGKTTLLRILAGVLTPTAGRVDLIVANQPVPEEERAFMTGYVAPYLNVYDGFSARENLRFLARLRRIPDPSAQIESVLELVGLSHRSDDLVGTYSSGMKQRVKYAAACLSDPPVLLLDEPSTNLDAQGLKMVNTVMHRQRSAGRLLIVATNDPREAESCDQILRIEDYHP